MAPPTHTALVISCFSSEPQRVQLRRTGHYWIDQNGTKYEPDGLEVGYSPRWVIHLDTITPIVSAEAK